VLLVLSARAEAQSLSSRAEAWGQTYRPAGLVNLESRAYAYPWVRAEAQVWAGATPSADGSGGDVVVLAAHVREPTGHAALRAGRFVLTTGAVRPVHLDGGHLRVQADMGAGLELFSGVPVVPRFGARPFDWLLGARASQRLSDVGTLGVSYVEQRDRGREVNEEIGADAVLLPVDWVSVSGRWAWDLVSQGMSEVQVSSAIGHVERRLEVFGSARNASRILPATSLFSVLSDSPSVQSGLSGRYRLFPRLRVEGLSAYRGHAGQHGARMKLSATLFLDDEGAGSLSGEVTRDGVGDSRWTGVRSMFVRELIHDLRLAAEVELVVPDDGAGQGGVWPWGRLSARYAFLEHFELSAGAEGSSTPQFQRLFQALFRLAYVGGAT
jgi:hypothetical protein